MACALATGIGKLFRKHKQTKKKVLKAIKDMNEIKISFDKAIEGSYVSCNEYEEYLKVSKS